MITISARNHCTRHLLVAILLFSLPAASLAQDSSRQQKAVGLSIGLPWANGYVYHDYALQSSKTKWGFVGIEGSVFYKRSGCKLVLNAGITGDLPAPAGPVDFAHEGSRTAIRTAYIEGLYYKNVLGNLSLVAGVNFMNYHFSQISYEDSIPEYGMNDRTIGLTAGLEYSIWKNIGVGVFYRPAIVSFDTKQYRHQLSLDLRFDINIIHF